MSLGFAQRGFSLSEGILSFAQGNSQNSQRSLGDGGLVWIPTFIYTVYLSVKQLNENITKFFNVKNLTLAPQYRKRRRLQISTASTIHNHLRVAKPARHVMQLSMLSPRVGGGGGGQTRGNLTFSWKPESNFPPPSTY